MKKFFIFIIVFIIVFIHNFPSFKAFEILELPSLYIEEGVGNESYLYQENYTVISGVVDWYREGTYNVTYEDSFNNIYNKKYIIIPKNDSYYFITKQNENEIKLSNYHQIIDVFYINENSFYVISNYQIEEPTGPDQEKISVIYYEDYQYKWEYRYYKYSRYVSGCLNNDNIVITGLVYNENNYYINTIVLFEVTKERQVIKSREVSSDKSCFVYDLYLDNNYIYLITVTNGSKNDYDKYKQDDKSKIVIFKIDCKNFQIITGITIDELENFIFVDASYYDRRLTINVLLKEKQGIFTNCIYEYNDTLQFINKYYFSINNKDYLGHQVTKDELCFFSIDNTVNENCVKIEYLNSGVDNKNITLDLYNTYYINYVQVVNVDGNNIYFSLNNITNKASYFLGFCKINSVYNVSYFTTSPEGINVIKAKCANGLLLQMYNKQDKLYSRVMDLIEINTIKTETNKVKNCIKTIYHDCNELLKNTYEIQLNNNVFGKYKNVYFYIDNNYNEYYLQDEIEIIFQCNVKENEVYQIGYKLDFNGLGSLNGNIINSGYIINDIGKYQLVIGGVNETKIITFSISDLTVNHIERPSINYAIINTEEYVMPSKNENYDETQYDFIAKENLKNTVPISLLILSLGIIIFLLLRNKI